MSRQKFNRSPWVACAAAVAIGATCSAHAFDRIDVTKDVREAGDLCTLESNSAARDGYPLTKLVDGNVQTGNKYFSNYFNAGPVYQAYSNSTEHAVLIGYAIDDNYESGKDVVIDGYEISISSGDGNALLRLPYTWRFEGSSDGESWTVLDESDGFLGWETPVVDNQKQYCAHFHFHNSAAYRRYRFAITSQRWAHDGSDPETGNLGALQIGEIRLFGYVGVDIEGKVDEGLCDLTESVRRVGLGCRTLRSNLTQYSADYTVDKAFDGSAMASGGTDRFFSAYTSVKAAYDQGGAYIEYEFTDCYAHGADIVITGYSILTGRNQTGQFHRMPCDWKFQAYDEAKAEWTTLDEYTGFKLWDGAMAWNGGSQLGFDFSFVNAASYRRYRLLITRQAWATIADFGDPAESNRGAMQISEIRLLGYVGKDIAGTIVTRPAEYPLDFLTWSSVKYDGNYTATTPTISNSPYTTLGGTFGNLFNGKEEDRGWCWLNDAEGHTDEIPFSISYELPEDAFAGKTVKLVDYVIEVNKAWAGWEVGIPLSWQLEAKYQDEWVALDRRRNFTDWGEKKFTYTDGGVSKEGTACYGRFKIDEERQFSSTKFRLKINAFAGKYSDRQRDLFMLSELTLNGTWGKDIVRREPNRKGILLIVR